jgi:AraC-like DNA-binding protein
MFRATKIDGYLKAMQRQGITAKRLLASTGIAPKLVASPEYLISLEQYHAVVANMMALTKNPGIAFSLGDIANLNEIGIVGYAMISSHSLRQALDIWIQFSNSLIGTPINVESFHDVSPGYELIVSTPSRVGALHRFETEELLVQGMKLVHDLTGIKPVIGRLSFNYPEPPHRKLYEKFCKCTITFDAPQTVFRVLQPELDAPIRTGNEELFRICAQHCRDVMRSLPESGLLRSRLRTLFLASPGNLPDLNAAGQALAMSSSTLRRQLESSGQSYQGIKDEFRFDLAREYLRSGHMAPKQVAYLLGFTSPSAFSRAFKGWSGQTVGQFFRQVKVDLN